MKIIGRNMREAMLRLKDATVQAKRTDYQDTRKRKREGRHHEDHYLEDLKREHGDPQGYRDAKGRHVRTGYEAPVWTGKKGWPGEDQW